MANKTKYYIESMRLRTLPLAVAGVVMGGLMAGAYGYWNTAIFVWAMLTALSLQILSNIANELGDLQKGTDNDNRLGPIRSVQSGKLTEGELKQMLVVFVLLSMLFGTFLVYTSFGTLFSKLSLLMLGLGAFAIVAAIKYTFGERAYGYVGLGDFFVFLFFGLVSVMGVYFLMTKSLPYLIILPASAIGFLSTAMLNLNNMRDIENDSMFEKKTIAVRAGLRSTKIYHLALIMLAFVLMTLYGVLQGVNLIGYLFLLPLPVFIWHLIYVLKNNGKNLDKHMKVIALSTVAFSILGGVGLLLSEMQSFGSRMLL